MHSRALIFYNGTIPVLSLLQSVMHLACLHFATYLPFLFILSIAILGSIAWIIQSSIWTSCELSGGVMSTTHALRVPLWCPQSTFTDDGRDISAALTIFKNAMAWLMVLAYIALAVFTILHRRQEEAGERLDKFHELVEFPQNQFAPPPPPKPARNAFAMQQMRPYSSTFLRREPEKAPGIKILTINR